MNKVYYKRTSTKPLTQELLTKESGIAFDVYPMERIQGNHCDCNGNGEFVLLSKNNKCVVEGGKPYMKCRICGGYSHL